MISIECIFIDLGSRNTKGAWEPVGIKFSSFPSTLLYISNNKVPISDYQFSDSDSDMDMNEDFDQQERLENSLKTTSIQALPNFSRGFGDNLWAMAMVILQCILGWVPTLSFGMEKKDVYRCITSKDFFNDFLTSETYKNFYKDDEEFKVIENFLKVGLSRDKEARHEACKELFDKDGSQVKRFEVDAGLFKSALAEYCDAF